MPNSQYYYYLKKCGHQELGSVGLYGTPQRGRYLLTSMYDKVLQLFPPLSKYQLNDSALLPIVPLYSGKKVYCNFVYHNDKFNGSTAEHPRNEYRLYLNSALEGNQLLFKTDDIVVMRKGSLQEEGEPQTVYYMDLLSNHSSMEYCQLNRVIENFTEIRGGYGLYDGYLSFFESKVDVLENRGVSAVEIDDSVTRRIETTAPSGIEGLFNAQSFRDFVMRGYGNKCAITGTVIQYKDFMNLEAAHIMPRSHGGTFLPSNGMALCRDLHWAFDKGFYTLTDDYKIQVHPDTTSDYLQSFNGQLIRVPSDSFFKPNIESIRYHRENVYGMFLISGRL